MANQVFQGERLSFVGTLKDNNVTTTDYTLICQIYGLGQLIREVPCSVDAVNHNYYGSIDTSALLGNILIRFVARTAGGDKIVSNEWIEKTIAA